MGLAAAMWAEAGVLACGMAEGGGRVGGRTHALTVSAADTGSNGRLALLTEVRRELATARDTSYQHKTEVSAAEGAYHFDCSGFVGYALAQALPADLAALPLSTSARPLARDFVHHFQSLADHIAPADSTAPGGWRPVAAVAELRPGDVIAWLKAADVRSRNTGHVLVVVYNPVANPARPDEWLVKVADSTESPHAHDSRGGDGDGLGTGIIGLSVDETGHPVGYYWRGGVSTALKRTEIGLGRPA